MVLYSNEFIQYRKTYITRETLTRLHASGGGLNNGDRPAGRNKTWINDELINLHCKMLNEKGMQSSNPHVVFHTSLLLRFKRATCKRSAAKDSRENPIFCLDSTMSSLSSFLSTARDKAERCKPVGLHMFPYCTGVHWCVITVDFGKKVVTVVDPYGWSPANGDLFLVARAFLAVVLSEKKHNGGDCRIKGTDFAYKWAIIPKECRQESNDTTNCGLFALCLMDAIDENPTLTEDWSSLTADKCSPTRAKLGRRELFSEVFKHGHGIRTGG